MHPPITPSGASACPSLGRRLPRCVATLIVPAALLAIVALPAVASAKGRSADSDGDHLSDRYERRVSHTNPRRADTDRDGLRDRYEIRRSKTNPRRRDTDKDGLSDRYEWRRSHTNPRRRDTDKDGLSDRYEWRRSHTNPRRRDTDKDGLSDRQELFPVGYLAPGKPAQSVRAFAIKTPRTDPRRRDTDGDGLTDGYEVRRSFTNPIMRDTDGDGLTDGQEVLTTHTNPLSRDTDGDGISDYAAVRPGSGAASTTPRPATTPPVASTPPVAATSGACASQTSNGVDGRDPWGGCFPGPSNTGVPAGTALTAYSGPSTVTAANTVIDGKSIGCIRVSAAGVVIRNSRIACPNGNAVMADDGAFSGTPLLIEDSTITCGDTPGSHALAEARITARRVNISHCENGGDINQNFIVEDSYIHDMFNSAAAHTDGLQFAAHFENGKIVPGSLNVTIRHNTIFGIGADGSFGTSAIITNSGGDTNILIDANLLAGGAYTLYCEQNATGNNYRVTNNVFTRKFKSTVGSFGPSTDCSDETQSGNTYDNGQPVTLD